MAISIDGPNANATAHGNAAPDAGTADDVSCVSAGAASTGGAGSAPPDRVSSADEANSQLGGHRALPQVGSGENVFRVYRGTERFHGGEEAVRSLP